MGKMTATLTGLATLEGDIAGSRFGGDEATVHDIPANTDANTSEVRHLAADGEYDRRSFDGRLLRRPWRRKPAECSTSGRKTTKTARSAAAFGGGQ